MTGELVNYAGFTLQPDPCLQGMKYGIRTGNDIRVHPAFLELAKAATPDELVELIRSLKLIHLPAPTFRPIKLKTF